MTWEVVWQCGIFLLVVKTSDATDVTDGVPLNHALCIFSEVDNQLTKLDNSENKILFNQLMHRAQN